MRYVFITIVLMLTCNVGPSSAGSVITPNTFISGTTAKASEVNANFTVLETEVNDNDIRIADLEWVRSHNVFALGEALQFLPGPSTTIQALLAQAEQIFDITTTQYRNGAFSRVDEMCQWSTRWQDLAYLAASDDAGRLAALEEHFRRMDRLSQIADVRFRNGAVTEVDPLTAQYYVVFADALVEGYKAKTGL